MYKLAILSCMLGAAVFAGDVSETPIVNVQKVSSEDLQAILEGDYSRMIVEFPAQTVLPIQFFLKGDLLNLVDNEMGAAKVSVQQPFYMKFEKDNFLLSTDLTNWKSITEFSTGVISVSLSASEEGPVLSFGAETNHRE